MRATARKRSFNAVKRGIASLGLMILVAGPIGCSGNQKQNPAPTAVQYLAAKRTKKTDEFLDKAAKAKGNLSALEKHVVKLRAEREAVRLEAILQKLKQKDYDLTSLEPIIAKGKQTVALIKAQLSKETPELEILKQQTKAAEEFSLGIKTGFNEMKKQKVKKTVDEMNELLIEFNKLEKKRGSAEIARKKKSLAAEVKARLQNIEGLQRDSLDVGSIQLKVLNEEISENEKRAGRTRKQLKELLAIATTKIAEETAQWMQRLKMLAKKHGADSPEVNVERIKMTAETRMRLKRLEMLKKKDE